MNEHSDLEGYEKWFKHLRSTGVNVEQPLRWRYRFDAWDRNVLENLFSKLQGMGYTNPEFHGSLESCYSLTVEIVEKRTPQVMLARDREIGALVKRDGEGQPWEHSMSVSWGEDGTAYSGADDESFTSPLGAPPGVRSLKG